MARAVDEVVAISSPKSTLYRCWTSAGAVADLYGDSAHHHPERGVDLPDATESQAVSSNDNPPVLLKCLVLVSTPWWLRKIAWTFTTRAGGGGSVQPFQGQPETVFLIGGAKDVPYDEIIKALTCYIVRV